MTENELDRKDREAADAAGACRQDYVAGCADTRERIAKFFERKGRERPEFAPLMQAFADGIRAGVEYNDG